MEGDGIGPEQAAATLPVLRAVEERFTVPLEILKVEGGDECLKRHGTPLPDRTVAAIKESDACLKGPVGETAADVIVRLRLLFDLYANLRPVKSYPHVSALKPNIDLLIVRENTEDLYRGIEFQVGDGLALALRVITREGSRRIAEFAFRKAAKRRRKVTAIHKSNVLKVTCGLFIRECREVAKLHPDVAYEEMYVDTASMELIRSPENFDVMLTPNLFGDILSDEAAQTVGGLGLAPGANIGKNFALFEPIHGSAPKIAGQQVANPCSLILASALMFEWLGEKFGDPRCLQAAEAVERAVVTCFQEGVVTPDLGGGFTTSQVGESVARLVEKA